MQALGTDPDVQKALSMRLMSWSLGMPYVVILTVKGEVQAAVGSQEAIGWMNMVEGCIALQWEEVQDWYYQAIGSQRSGQ
jgi:hypothetical protein